MAINIAQKPQPKKKERIPPSKSISTGTWNLPADEGKRGKLRCSPEHIRFFGNVELMQVELARLERELKGDYGSEGIEE